MGLVWSEGSVVKNTCSFRARQLMTVCNSGFRGSNTLFWTLKAFCEHGTQGYMWHKHSF